MNVHIRIFPNRIYQCVILFLIISSIAVCAIADISNEMRPLQNLHPLNFHPYTLRRMNIFDQKMPLEVTF